MKTLPIPNDNETSLDFVNTCCGIGELYGLNSYYSRRDFPELLFPVIAQGVYSYRDQFITKSALNKQGCPYILFSTAEPHGPRFAKYLTDEKLGPVYGGTPRNNPTGSSRLRVWLWEPDYNALWYWYADYYKNKSRRKK